MTYALILLPLLIVGCASTPKIEMVDAYDNYSNCIKITGAKLLPIKAARSEFSDAVQLSCSEKFNEFEFARISFARHRLGLSERDAYVHGKSEAANSRKVLNEVLGETYDRKVGDQALAPSP